MNKLIIFILTLLPVFSYSQVTSINIDTSASQVIIINNGTMIENNGGTVNVDNNYSLDEVNQNQNQNKNQIHSVKGSSDCTLLEVILTITGITVIIIAVVKDAYEYFRDE